MEDHNKQHVLHKERADLRLPGPGPDWLQHELAGDALPRRQVRRLPDMGTSQRRPKGEDRGGVRGTMGEAGNHRNKNTWMAWRRKLCRACSVCNNSDTNMTSYTTSSRQLPNATELMTRTCPIKRFEGCPRGRCHVGNRGSSRYWGSFQRGVIPFLEANSSNLTAVHPHIQHNLWLLGLPPR